MSELDYEVRQLDQDGNFIADRNNFVSLDMNLLVNDFSSCELPFGDPDLKLYNSLEEDQRWAITRKGYALGKGDWILRGKSKAVNEDGLRVTTVFLTTALEAATSPIVAYQADSPQAKKNQPLDDMMKAIIRENSGSLSVDTDRNVSQLISVQPNKGLAPTAEKGFSRQRILPLLQTISDLSAQLGTQLFFDVVAIGAGWQFQTYIGQPGTDRSNSLTFSLEQNTLLSASLKTDYLGSANVVYAGGNGEKSSRKIQIAKAQDRIDDSPFGRLRESFFGDGNLGTLPLILSAAQGELYDLRPREILDARINVFSNNDLGVHWFPGDRILYSLDDHFAEAVISPVRIVVSPESEETITANLRSLL